MISAQVREREEEKMVRDSRSKSEAQKKEESMKFQKGCFIREKGKSGIGRIVGRYEHDSLEYAVINYEFPQRDGALMVADGASTFLELVSPEEVLTSRIFETYGEAEKAVKRYATVEFWRDFCGQDEIEIGRIKRVEEGIVVVGFKREEYRCLQTIYMFRKGWKVGIQEVR